MLKEPSLKIRGGSRNLEWVFEQSGVKQEDLKAALS